MEEIMKQYEVEIKTDGLDNLNKALKDLFDAGWELAGGVRNISADDWAAKLQKEQEQEW